MVSTRLLFTLAMTVIPSVFAVSCSEYTSCSSCTNVTGCHFCEFDNRCHTIGSVYGCAFGVNCYTDNGCMRDTPTEIGAAYPSSIVVFGVLIVFCTVGLCAVSCMWMCSALRAQATTVVYKDGRYHELQTHVQECDRGRRNGRRQRNGGSGRDQDEEWSWASARDDGDSDDGVDEVPFVEHFQESRFVRTGYYTSLCLCFSLVFLTFFFGIVALLYAPSYPTYAVCNTELDWNSIISGGEAASLRGDFEILLSVRNPNRLDLTVLSAEAKLWYKGERVGYAAYDHPFELPGGTIADALVTVSFRPSAAQALSISADYMAGELWLSMDASLDADVRWGGSVLHEFSTSIQGYRFDVAADTGGRELCKCPY